MKEITLRYKVVGIQRCQTCGHVEIKSIIHGGTAEDPTERPPQIDAPDPNTVIKSRTAEEEVTRRMMQGLRGAFPFLDARNIQRIPGGAMITLDSRKSPGALHNPSRRTWNLSLTEEEYELIAPITIGDVLVQKISMEAD